MAGWTHEEARHHTLVERLLERCATYDESGLPCHHRLREIDWCERCLAASVLLDNGLD